MFFDKYIIKDKKLLKLKIILKSYSYCVLLISNFNPFGGTPNKIEQNIDIQPHCESKERFNNWVLETRK